MCVYILLGKYFTIKIFSPFFFGMICQIFFGQNLVWKNIAAEGKGKIIKVGDKVKVLGKVASVAEAVV